MRIKSNIFALAITILGMLSAKAQDNYPVACAGSVVRYGVEDGLPDSFYEWGISGGQILVNYNDSVDVLWGNTPGSFTIQVTEYAEGRCDGGIKEATILISAPNVELNADQLNRNDHILNLCEGESKETWITGDFVAYNWNVENNDESYEISDAGKIIVEVVDEHQCVAKDSIIAILNEMPEINLGNDTVLCGDDFLVLNGGNNGMTFAWSTGDNSQYIEVGAASQQYYVDVTDVNNCSNSDTIMVLSCDLVDQLEIPNIMTPNGDGDNDFFEFPQKELFPEMELEIFDRLGRRVFKSDVGYTEAWDGTFNGEELPMDSYYYIVDLKGGLEPVKGTIAIVR